MPASKIPKPSLLPLKLRHIRTSRGLTLISLLKSLGYGNKEGIYDSTVTTYESGKKEPPLLVLLAYARLGDVSVDSLVDDSIGLEEFKSGVKGAAGQKEASAPATFKGLPYTPLGSELIDKESRAFSCPNCKARIQFLLRVKVYGVKEVSPEEDTDTTNRTRMKAEANAEQREIVELAKQEGVIEALRQAVEASSTSKPRDIEQFFLTFISNATRTSTPEFALRQCLVDKTDAKGNLELYTLNGIGAVLADGVFRVFMPTELIQGKPLKRLGVKGGAPTSKETTTLEVWVKTRYGYVVGRGAYMSELRRRAIGAFAKAST